MSSVPQNNPQPGLPRPALSFNERRRDRRQIVLTRATLNVVDGHNAGFAAEIQTRDVSSSGVCFLLREELHVGQLCHVSIPGQSQRTCEVIRSRQLSSGKFEMAVEFRD
ncbi:MAG: PilZ domain-containing protein [Tepidisphaerales bacterium]